MNIRSKKWININFIYTAIDFCVATVLISAFLFLSSSNTLYSQIKIAYTKTMAVPYLIMYAIAAVGLFLILRKFYKENNHAKVYIYIFYVAVILRVAVCFLDMYIPTSDFKNYYMYGLNVYYGKYTDVANTIGIYKIPTMGGLAVVNSLIMRIFSPSLRGLQIANCIITSGVCIIIVKILSKKSLRMGAIAGFLYAIYPSNIIASSVTANVHICNFFAYLGILVFLNAIENEKGKKLFIYSLLCMVLFTAATFTHNAYVFKIAILVFTMFYQLKEYILCKKMLRNMWICVLIVILGGTALSKVTFFALKNQGIIKSYETQPLLTTLVVGLNNETSGTLKPAAINDRKKVMAAPIEERNKVALEIIKNDMSDKKALMHLFAKKTYGLWFFGDSYFSWIRAGYTSEYGKLQESGKATEEMTEKLEWIKYFNTVGVFIDTVFVHIIYLFAAIGIIIRDRSDFKDLFSLLIIIIFGWMVVFCLMEIQTRYRYYAMPAFMCMATYGMCEVKEFLKKKRILFWKKEDI